MSRSIKQIYDEMIIEKQTFSSLDTLVPNPDKGAEFLKDLTSQSKVAIWRLIFWVVAFAIFTHEKLFDIHVTNIEAAAKAVTPGTVPWYVVEAKKFQNGFALEFNVVTSKFEYSDTISDAAIASQIVDHASARDINQIVTLKISKVVTGVTQKLTAAEKAGFTTYLEEFKIAGTKTLVISDDPDFLKIAYTIEFDPQLLTSTGVLISDGTIKPIQVAIDNYISVDAAGAQGLPFDATFRVQDLTDAIQAATGVVNAIADVVEAKFAATSFSDILAVVTESYIPNAGYLATVNETGTETVPVIGDLPILTPVAYQTTGAAYTADVSVVREAGIVYRVNVNIADPAGVFDKTKWNTLANLTFISI